MLKVSPHRKRQRAPVTADHGPSLRTDEGRCEVVIPTPPLRFPVGGGHSPRRHSRGGPPKPCTPIAPRTGAGPAPRPGLAAGADPRAAFHLVRGLLRPGRGGLVGAGGLLPGGT